MGVTTGCGYYSHIYNSAYSSIKRSRVQITVDQGSKAALKPNQAIKSQFQRSKLLIAVADRSTGHIAVTTPCMISQTVIASVQRTFTFRIIILYACSNLTQMCNISLVQSAYRMLALEIDSTSVYSTCRFTERGQATAKT